MADAVNDSDSCPPAKKEVCSLPDNGREMDKGKRSIVQHDYQAKI